MERTKLCELDDSQLDSKYIQQRTGLRELVQQLAKPKRVNGKVMTGPGLADLVSQMVTALNARDIPTAGSILEHFNKELVYRWVVWCWYGILLICLDLQLGPCTTARLMIMARL